MVGAGTYMFALDETRVVDATRTGSVAHLINHSCEPNCYTRIISAGGDHHIIIFAMRDLEVGPPKKSPQKPKSVASPPLGHDARGACDSRGEIGRALRNREPFLFVK